MRSLTDAKPLPWPVRIFRPWFVASCAGAALGSLLLTLPPTATEEPFYLDISPRAAAADAHEEQPRPADLLESALSGPGPLKTPSSILADTTRPSAEHLPASLERNP